MVSITKSDLSNVVVILSVVIAGVIVVLYQLGYTNTDAVGIASMLLKVVFGGYLGVKGLESCVAICADAYVKCKGKKMQNNAH